MPAMDLGRADNFNDTNYIIAFAPESKTTEKIMSKVASAPFMKGMFLEVHDNFFIWKICKFILEFP